MGGRVYHQKIWKVFKIESFQKRWLFKIKISKTTFRSNDFKEDDAIWKNGEDGGTGGGGPPPTGMGNMGPTGGYVAK